MGKHCAHPKPVNTKLYNSVKKRVKKETKKEEFKQKYKIDFDILLDPSHS